MKPVKWNAAKTKKELAMRLRDAKKAREQWEHGWHLNEEILLNFDGSSQSEHYNHTIEDAIDGITQDLSSSDMTVGVNYVFKHHRFLLAQMSANPPRVQALPTSSDPTDKQKASAADKVMKHAARKENIQEKVDGVSNKCLLYGTAFLKTFQDKNKGQIVSRDPKTGEFELEGGIDMYSPSTWDIFIDPKATCWDEVRYVFERYKMPYEQALTMFPDSEDKLKQAIQEQCKREGRAFDPSTLEEEDVELYEYWEKGLAANAFLGRYGWCMLEGDLLEDDELKDNPHAFAPALDKGETEDDRMPEVAELPYDILTDIDVADQVYGLSFINYEGPIQDIINRLDTVTLDAVSAHGVCRMVLPETAEIMQDSVMNTNYDIIKVTGNQGPFFVNTPSLMPETHMLRDRLKMGGDDTAGVNESMFGQQSRETSGFSMQYATNQGNMTRRRLFNKYQMFVESLYRRYLNLARKHWTDYKLVQVMGAEGAFEAIQLKGADIDGGYDLYVQYGGFSLDPDTRREQIMQLKPLFQEAGIDTKTILSMMNITDLDQLYDIMELAPKRQQEIFQEMLKTKVMIQPRELQEHKGMLDYAYRYVMTAEFMMLPEADKALIEGHIKAREAKMAEQPQAGAAPAGGGAAPPGGLAGPNPMAPPVAPAGMVAPPMTEIPQQ